MQSIETVPAPPLDFTGQKSLGVVASTNHVEITPKYGGTFKAGDIIRLEIPSQNWFDAEKFRVTFRGKVYQSGGTAVPMYGANGNYLRQFPDDGSAVGGDFCCFKNGIQHAFNRVKLLQGSRVIEDIQEYGQLSHLLHVTTIPEDHSEEVLSKEGFGKSDDFEHWLERKIQPTRGSKGHLYEVELYLGLFKTGKYLPTKYMGQLTIELYLETNINSLLASQKETFTLDTNTVGTWASGQVNLATPTALARAVTRQYGGAYYQFEDVNAQCHFVVPIDEYDRAALAQIESGSFEIHYDTFRAHTRQTSAVQRQTLSIQEKALSVKNIFSVMRNQAGLNSMYYDTHYASNSILEYQWKIGNEYFPAQPVRCSDGGVRALTQLRDALGGTSDMLSNGQLDRNKYCPESHLDDNKIFNIFPVEDSVHSKLRSDRKSWFEIANRASLPNQFIIGQSFEKSQGQLSGFNTVESQVDIELIITLQDHQKLAAGPPAQSSIVFQPLKAPVHISNRADRVPWKGTYNIAKEVITHNEDAAQVNGLTYFMQESTDTTSTTTNATNSFTQVLSWVQVDAILRMRGLGQLEVVS